MDRFFGHFLSTDRVRSWLEMHDMGIVYVWILVSSHYVRSICGRDGAFLVSSEVIDGSDVQLFLSLVGAGLRKPLNRRKTSPKGHISMI